MGSDDLYLVWSNEHRMWWRGNRSGYTGKLDKAGRYSRADAIAICKAASENGPRGFGWEPSEIPVREADALEALIQAQERAS